MLQEVFNLKVFIDCLVWGSADRLLKEIDNIYCQRGKGHYSYKARNFSTSHVHSMLTTSIMEIMDKSEAIFFINTNNSIYNLDDSFQKDYTLSPWIYEELMLSKLLRKVDLPFYRSEITQNINENTSFQPKLNIAYPVDINSDMTELSLTDIICWKKEWKKRKTCIVGSVGSNKKSIHPLDILYMSTR